MNVFTNSTWDFECDINMYDWEQDKCKVEIRSVLIPLL